jgi:hypothetical protein
MKKQVRAFVENVLARFQLELTLIPKLPPEYEATYRKVRPYTMTSRRRVFTLIDAVEHVVRHQLPGDFIECGVWKGGSSLAAALTFARLSDLSRDFYLFDTFEGMSAPTEKDGVEAQEGYTATLDPKKGSTWCRSPLEEVREVLKLAEYPTEKIHFIQGKVEETLPGAAPEQIAILRLDTDWYESTKHELNTLYPRLIPGGVLLLDDYGFWQGARQAVDEYLAEHKIDAFLHRIDETGAILIKPGSSR